MISTLIAIILSIIALLIITHLIITKILPLIKQILLSLTKSEEPLHNLMVLLIFVIAIFSLSQILTLLLSLNNQYINLLNILTPSINFLLEINKYLIWIVVAIIIALGLKK